MVTSMHHEGAREDSAKINIAVGYLPAGNLCLDGSERSRFGECEPMANALFCCRHQIHRKCETVRPFKPTVHDIAVACTIGPRQNADQERPIEPAALAQIP